MQGRWPAHNAHRDLDNLARDLFGRDGAALGPGCPQRPQGRLLWRQGSGIFTLLVKAKSGGSSHGSAAAHGTPLAFRAAMYLASS